MRALIVCRCGEWPQAPCTATATAEDWLCDVCRPDGDGEGCALATLGDRPSFHAKLKVGDSLVVAGDSGPIVLPRFRFSHVTITMGEAE